MNDLPRNGPGGNDPRGDDPGKNSPRGDVSPKHNPHRDDPRRDEANREPAGEEPPPFGRSWNVLYAIVVLNLALLILLFYAFTRAFS